MPQLRGSAQAPVASSSLPVSTGSPTSIPCSRVLRPRNFTTGLKFGHPGPVALSNKEGLVPKVFD